MTWIYYYIDTGNDATVLLDACIGVFNGIEWIATKFKYGNTPFDITGATIRTGNIADAIATAISSNGVAVILKYFSDEKIGSLFAEYETLFYKIYDEIRLQSLINSGKTLLNIIEVMGGDYLYGVPDLFFSATDLFDSYFELETWKEIFSLKEKR